MIKKAALLLLLAILINAAFYFFAFLTNLRLFGCLLRAKDHDFTTELGKANITGIDVMNYATIISTAWSWGLLASC